ncbi:MAG: hypothetical protein AAGI14_12145 [Pseudomonadota bacterium]
MADESKNSSNNATGLLVLLIIAGGWSFFNYNNASQEFYTACVENARAVASYADRDDFCSCTRDKTLENLSIMSHVPILGRFLGNDEAEARSILLNASNVCAAANPRVTFNPPRDF